MVYRTGNERSHCFFKEYLPKHGYDGVKIPDAFVEKYLNGFPRKAVLQNSMGKLSQVEMGYTVSGVFEIKIFGKCGSEKRETGADEDVQFEVKMEEEEDEDVDDDQEVIKAK